MDLISIGGEPAESDDVRWCFEQYYAELDRRMEGGFDVATALPLAPAGLHPPQGLVLVARLAGEPVGCGAVKLDRPAIAEIKRLWVSPVVRRQGLGRRLLVELESHAMTDGKWLARLDTNHCLTEAIALYRRHGYREVPRFNEERFADHWFERDLTPDRIDDEVPSRSGHQTVR